MYAIQKYEHRCEKVLVFLLACRTPTTWSESSGWCSVEMELSWRVWWRISSTSTSTLCPRSSAEWYRWLTWMLTIRWPTQLQENLLSFVELVAIADFLDGNSEWCGHPGDDEEMLGGKSLCVVSSHSCGSLASLQLSSEPRTQQVMRYVSDDVISATLHVDFISSNRVTLVTMLSYYL